jgi:tight adherence protein B
VNAVVLAALAGLAVALWPPNAERHVAASFGFPGSAPGSSRRVWIPRLRSSGHAQPLDPAAVLALVEAVAPALDAGLPPAAALAFGLGGIPGLDRRPSLHGQAGGSGQVTLLHGAPSVHAAASVLDSVRLAAQQGRPVGPVWQAAADRAGSVHLHLLGAAWTLSESTGAPLAEAARTTAGVLRSAAAQERRMASAVAGARATMNLLSVLPVGGPLVALALGIGPLELYTTSPAAELSLAAGVALAFAGRWWVRRLVAVVIAGPVVL